MTFGLVPARKKIQWDWPAGPAEKKDTMRMVAGWIFELSLYIAFFGQKRQRYQIWSGTGCPEIYPDWAHTVCTKWVLVQEMYMNGWIKRAMMR